MPIFCVPCGWHFSGFFFISIVFYDLLIIFDPATILPGEYVRLVLGGEGDDFCCPHPPCSSPPHAEKSRFCANPGSRLGLVPVGPAHVMDIKRCNRSGDPLQFQIGKRIRHGRKPQGVFFTSDPNLPLGAGMFFQRHPTIISHGPRCRFFRWGERVGKFFTGGHP